MIDHNERAPSAQTAQTASWAVTVVQHPSVEVCATDGCEQIAQHYEVDPGV